MVFTGEQDFNTNWFGSKITECRIGMLFVVLFLSWRLGLQGPCLYDHWDLLLAVLTGPAGVVGLLGWSIRLLVHMPYVNQISPILPAIVSTPFDSSWFLMVWPSRLIIASTLIISWAPSAASWSAGGSHPGQLFVFPFVFLLSHLADTGCRHAPFWRCHRCFALF